MNKLTTEIRSAACVRCKRDTSGEMMWPDKKDDELCQECWETECRRSWWKMVNAINAAYRDLAEGAKALEAEADLLDPSRVRNREEKQKLADKHAQEAKAAAEKAEASKADLHSA
jgi:hypothetical protein